MTYIEKNDIKEVTLGEDGWSKATSPEGVRTYTATQTTTATIIRSDGTTQSHTGVNPGSKIVRRNGGVELEMV